MKPGNSRDEFEVFYVELSQQADFISDLDDITIQDEHYNEDDANPRGLSDEQVSKLANDSLDSTQAPEPKDPPAEQELFSENNE